MAEGVAGMSDDIEIMNTVGSMERVTRYHVEILSQYREVLQKFHGWSFYQTLRDLLLAGFCLLFLIGCSNPATEAWQLALREADSAILSTATETRDVVRENTTALQEIKESIDTLEASLVNSEAANSQEVISESDTESSKNANDSHTRNTVVAEEDSVPLIVTYADFHCPPCERLKADIEADKFAGFTVTVDNDWKPKSYPAIRYPWQTETGWAVEYGYDSGMADRLRAKLMPKKAQAVALSPMSQQEMIDLHNSLHGGGQWTWPGDLETHLRTTHGVNTGGAPVGAIFPNQSNNRVIRSRSPVRFVSWWPFGNRRSNFVSRSSCPTCPN